MEVSKNSSTIEQQLQNASQVKVKSKQCKSKTSSGNSVSVLPANESLLSSSDKPEGSAANKIRVVKLASPALDRETELSSPVSKGVTHSADSSDNKQYHHPESEKDESNTGLNESSILSLSIPITPPACWMGRPFVQLWKEACHLKTELNKLPGNPEETDQTSANKKKAVTLFLRCVALRSRYLTYLQEYKSERMWINNMSGKKSDQINPSEKPYLDMHYYVTKTIISYVIDMPCSWNFHKTMYCAMMSSLGYSTSEDYVEDSCFKRLKSLKLSQETEENMEIMELFSSYPENWDKTTLFSCHFGQFIANTNYGTELFKKQPDREERDQELSKVDVVLSRASFVQLLKETDYYIFRMLHEDKQNSALYIGDRLHFINSRKSVLEEADLDTINALLHYCELLLWEMNDKSTCKILTALDKLALLLATAETRPPDSLFIQLGVSILSWGLSGLSAVFQQKSESPRYISVLTRLFEIRKSWIAEKEKEGITSAREAAENIDKLQQMKRINESKSNIMEPLELTKDTTQKTATVQASKNVSKAKSDKSKTELPPLPTDMAVIREWKITKFTGISQVKNVLSHMSVETTNYLDKLSERADSLNAEAKKLNLDFSVSGLCNENIKHWKSKAETLLTEYNNYLGSRLYQLYIMRSLTFSANTQTVEYLLATHEPLQKVVLTYSRGLSRCCYERSCEILVHAKKTIITETNLNKEIATIKNIMDTFINDWIKQELFSICHLNIYCYKGTNLEKNYKDPVSVCLRGMIFFAGIYKDIRKLEPAAGTKNYCSCMIRWHQLKDHIKTYLCKGKIAEYFNLVIKQLQTNNAWLNNDDYTQTLAILKPYFQNESAEDAWHNDLLKFNFDPEVMPLTATCTNIIISTIHHSFQYHLARLQSKDITAAQWKESKENLMAITQFTFNGPLSLHWFQLIRYQQIPGSEAEELISLMRKNQVASIVPSSAEHEAVVNKHGESAFDIEPSAYEGKAAKTPVKSTFKAPTASWLTEDGSAIAKRQGSTHIEETEEERLFTSAEKEIKDNPLAAIALLKNIKEQVTEQSSKSMIYRARLGIAEASTQIVLPSLINIPKAIESLKKMQAEMQTAINSQSYTIKKDHYERLMTEIKRAVEQHPNISETIDIFEVYINDVTDIPLHTGSKHLPSEAVKAIKDQCEKCRELIKQYSVYLETVLQCVEKRNEMLRDFPDHQSKSNDALDAENTAKQAARKENANIAIRAQQIFPKALDKLKKYK